MQSPRSSARSLKNERLDHDNLHRSALFNSLLEPAKWADFILVDRDLFKIAPADIWKIKVQQTWVGGRRVY